METKFLLNKTSIQIVEKKIDLFGNFIHHNNISSIFIIVDSNSKKYCLKDFISINSSLANSKVIEINPGEASKSLQVLNQICLQLVNLQIDRNSLIINLGGGVVSDRTAFRIPYISNPKNLEKIDKTNEICPVFLSRSR